MAFVPVSATVPTFTGLRAASSLAPRRRAAVGPSVPMRVRMIATEPSAAAVAAPAQQDAVVLTPRAVELLSYIRAHKSIFRPGLGFNSTTATLCRKNDTGRCFTPDDELDTNAHELAGVSVARHILAHADAIAADGADAIAAAGASAVGSDAKVRDIVEFNMTTVLRAVSYAAAVQSDDFVHVNNVGMMKMLHDELSIAPAAVAAGMDAMKKFVVDAITEDDLVETTGLCFDAMKEHLA